MNDISVSLLPGQDWPPPIPDPGPRRQNDTAACIIQSVVSAGNGGPRRLGTLSLHHSRLDPLPAPEPFRPEGFVDFAAVVRRATFAHPCPDLFHVPDGKTALAWIPREEDCPWLRPSRSEDGVFRVVWTQEAVNAIPYYLARFLIRTPSEDLLKELQSNRNMPNIDHKGERGVFESMVRGLAMLLIKGPYCLHSPCGKIYPAKWAPDPRCLQWLLAATHGQWTQCAIDRLPYAVSRLLGLDLSEALLDQLELVMYNTTRYTGQDPYVARLCYDLYRSLLQNQLRPAGYSTTTATRRAAKLDLPPAPPAPPAAAAAAAPR